MATATKVTAGNHKPGKGNGRFRVYSKQFNDLVDVVNELEPADGTLSADIIQEDSAGTGVTIDGLLIQDGQVDLTDNNSIIYGTGDDVSVNWNGTYLEGNAAANAMWDGCPVKSDPNYMTTAFDIEDDFYELDTTATVGKWINNAVGTGTVTIDDDVAGGICLLTCQATTDDAAEQISLVSAPFFLAAGKTLWYECRLKLVGDAQSEVSFGLAALGEDLTAVADVLPADGVSFSSQDATLDVDLTLSKDGTDTGAVSGVHTMVSNTYVTFGFKIDGVTSVTPYIDGVAGTAATATFNDDEAMCPYFLVRNGDATTQQVLHIDYVRVVQLR